MEDVLELYSEEPDPARPVVCFDEKPYQLIGETRVPIRAKPGQPERFDDEYRRNGTANIFVFVDAHQSWRHAKVTAQRTNLDFAVFVRLGDGDRRGSGSGSGSGSGDLAAPATDNRGLVRWRYAWTWFSRPGDSPLEPELGPGPGLGRSEAWA
jgi:hypothetical protein